MFNATKVSIALFGLVGFRNPIDPAYAIVDTANQTSRSGRFVNDNPIAKVEYIKQTQDYANATNDDFNTFLTNLQKRSIIEVMDAVMSQDDYIDRQRLYHYPSRKKTVETLQSGSFVGYEIEMDRCEPNVAFEISRVFLEFEGSGTVTLVLFNTAINTPIYTKTVTISSNNQVEPLNWRVDGTGNDQGGTYYFGYFTTGVTVQPVSRQNFDRANSMAYVTHLEVEPIEVLGVTGTSLFDIDDVDNTDKCHGLNPDFAVFNDYTDLIIRHEALFANAIQLQTVINATQEYVSSSRSNRSQRISEDQLNFTIAQLEGVEGRITGLIPTLKKEVFSLRKQIDKLISSMFSTGFELNTLS